MSKKITMQQIADYCGVSKFVVSKALSGKGGVSSSTKERVIQAASQLGYFAHKKINFKPEKGLPAQAGNGNHKQTVLVLMPNVRFQTKDSVYWGRIVDGVSARLEEMGLGMIIISEQSNEHFLQLFNPSGILGLIGVGEISTGMLLEVHRMGIPIVLIDHEDPLIPSDTVFVNNYDCMARLTKHLIGLGHRRLVFFGSLQFSRSFHDRWLGFRTALESSEYAGHEGDELLYPLEGVAEFQDQIGRWIQKQKKTSSMPTAIVCANDAIAIQAVQTLVEAGVRVPGEISVTGFDNIAPADQLEPSLTTVNVPKEMLGRRAVELLASRIADRDKPTEKLLVSGDLMLRNSSGEAAKAAACDCLQR
ncbi:LacI family DNA-binding transcriptional regulator [Paenibacillus gansuensis]|uniref:LacI family DNA-binding transcriptional regulator n=1 Tax=Paenibacillus gansuensis TaxID=306542 RepID=A0ABW5PC46_9BACL